MVTTDGHRLAHVVKSGTYDIKKEYRTLVGRKALGLLCDLVDGSVIEIAKDDTNIYFRSADWTVVSRIVTGQFPNYEAVMPKDNKNVAILVGSDLKATLGRVAQFADERSRAVKLSFDEKQGLTISASSTELGKASENVKSKYKGVPLSIGVNASYILDVLATVGKTDEVTIKIKDHQCAGMFVPVMPDSYQSHNVLMPIRL
jgi:DNA polymerase III subunit beta